MAVAWVASYAEGVIGHPIEEARPGGDTEARDRDDREHQCHHAAFDTQATEQGGDGRDEAHRSVLPHPQDGGEADPWQQPGEADDGRAECQHPGRDEHADDGPRHVHLDRADTGSAAPWVTVMNGSTIQAMTSPSPVPTSRLSVARTAFSSDSQTDSWPDDSPSARRSANSLIRSRAETEALTTKPTIAKRAAATNPIPSAPMIPRATGSVASVR